jgi:long-subunit fatty acid transport protein
MTRTHRCLPAIVLLAAAPLAAQDSATLDAFGLLVATQSRPSLSFLGAGARPAGMGGAFTALADDAAAASFNPAGLALLLTPEASVVYTARERGEAHAGFTDFEDGVLERYDPSASESSSNGVSFAAFTLPFTAREHNLTFQLSYHRPIDFTFGGARNFAERREDGSQLATIRQRVSQQGDIETFSLSAAYQLTERMSLGLSASRWQGDWAFATTTEEQLLDGPTERLRFRQQTELSGWRLGAGLLLRYRYLNVGASARFPFDADYRTSSSLATSFATPFPASSTQRGTLRWVGSWTVGIAVKPLDKWFLTVDYSEEDWDDMTLDGFGEEPVNFFDLQPADLTTARHTGTWRFGSELVLVRARQVLGLRLGGFLEPRPQLLAPTDEKSSLRGLTAGLGWKMGSVAVDLAWQHTRSTARVVEFVDPQTVATGSVEAQAEGRVETRENRVFLSLLYQFPSRQKLGRLLHFLFVGPLEKAPAEPAGPTPPPAEPAAPPPPAADAPPPPDASGAWLPPTPAPTG